MNCCICGSKLSFFQGTASLRYKDKQYPLCEHCSKTKIQLLNEKSVTIQEQAYSYFKDFLETKELADPNCKAALLDLLSEYDHSQADAERLRQQKDFEARWLQGILLTTGYTFTGYHITKYMGLLNASVVLGTGFLSEFSAGIADTLGIESERFSQKVEQAKQATQTNLKQKARAIKANAIIGIDYDIFMVGNNMVGVSINGTAVTIEPEIPKNNIPSDNIE